MRSESNEKPDEAIVVSMSVHRDAVICNIRISIYKM